MVIIQWKIGKKEAGRYLTPLHFRIQFKLDDKVKYGVKLSIRKKYRFPESIIFVQERRANQCLGASNLVGISYFHRGCSESASELVLDFDDIISFDTVSKINESLLHVKNSIDKRICSQKCPDCRAFIPWRLKRYDYSDYEAIFYQAAYDLCEAWNRAVAESIKAETLENSLIVTK